MKRARSFDVMLSKWTRITSLRILSLVDTVQYRPAQRLT